MCNFIFIFTFFNNLLNLFKFFIFLMRKTIKMNETQIEETSCKNKIICGNCNK